MADIRALEEETKKKLDEERAKGEKKGTVALEKWFLLPMSQQTFCYFQICSSGTFYRSILLDLQFCEKCLSMKLCILWYVGASAVRWSFYQEDFSNWWIFFLFGLIYVFLYKHI